MADFEQDLFLQYIKNRINKRKNNSINAIKKGKEAIYSFLKEKDSLTNKEKKVLKNIDRYPKNISIRLKNLKKHFKKLTKYQYGIDYLFSGNNEEENILNNDIKTISIVRTLLN